MGEGEKSDSISWKDLSPKEAMGAFFNGYAHFVNNKLTSLLCISRSEQESDSERLSTEINKLVKALSTEGISLKEANLNSKTAEEAIRETAGWLKSKIEGKIRDCLGVLPEGEDPFKAWFEKVKESHSQFYSLEGKEKLVIIGKESLERIKQIWENLEALADPQRKINIRVVSEEELAGGGTIFDFLPSQLNLG